jgi:hypothetical protein
MTLRVVAGAGITGIGESEVDALAIHWRRGADDVMQRRVEDAAVGDDQGAPRTTLYEPPDRVGRPGCR